MDNENLKPQSPAVTFEEKENVGSLIAFLRFMRRFIVFIAICTVLGAALGLGIALVKDKKVYTQTKSVIVIAIMNNKSTYASITLTKNLSNNISTLITSPVFIDKANEIHGGSDTDRIVPSAIGVSGKESMVFTISYSDYDKEIAEKKLDDYIKAVKEEINAGYLPANEVIINEIDNEPSTSVSNRFAKCILLGLVGGLVLGFAIAFLIYLFDNTVDSKTELERLTGTTVIAYIEDVA